MEFVFLEFNFIYMQNNVKHKVIVVVVLSTIFGLFGGLVGAIATRFYLLEKAFNIPLFSEISLGGYGASGSNLIIRDAKKVIVEQNTKAIEVAESTGNSIVGIFKKIKLQEEGLKIFKPQNFYNVHDELGQGFIITSDGWIMTDFIPSELQYAYTEKVKKNTLDNYVVMLKDKKIHSVDDIIIDKKTGYSFWHVGVNDLPVRGFVAKDDIHNGKLVIAVNWDGFTWMTTLTGMKTDSISSVKSSEDLNGEIILEQTVPEDFWSSFLFDFNGNILAVINKDGVARSIYSYMSCVDCLLNNKSLTRPVLGINYIELYKMVEPESDKMFNFREGIMIYKDKTGIAVIPKSPAEKAGLMVGDILISVNGIKINKENTLPYLISRYMVGDKIEIEYTREGKSGKAEVVLEVQEE